eukprot:6190953-Pleurochrysis_carterae.AAC.1
MDDDDDTDDIATTDSAPNESANYTPNAQSNLAEGSSVSLAECSASVVTSTQDRYHGHESVGSHDGASANEGTGGVESVSGQDGVLVERGRSESGVSAWEEAPLFEEECEMVRRGGVAAGTLRLSRTALQARA